MKKIFITSAAVFLFMFTPLEVAPRGAGLLTGFTFFVLRLNADQQPPLAATQTSISMDFKDASLKDILKVFSMQSEMNFIASEAVQDRKVTLYLDKVPLNQVMDKIFSANNLTYELNSGANIFVVKEWGKMETETVTKVFYLKNATVSTSALREDLSQGLAQVSSTSTGTSTSTSTAVVSSRNRFKEESEGCGITSAIRKLLSPAPVGSLVEDFRTNSIIVTDTPMKMKVISQVIAALDVSVPQVMLEVEMLDVSKNVIDKMGFEFGDTPFTAILTGATAATGFPYNGWTKIRDGAKGSLSINPTGSTYNMQLDFMRTQKDTKFLARPKLLTLNNETAKISITKDEIMTTEKSWHEATTTSPGYWTYTYKRATELALTRGGVGISLKVTPQINEETGEITMVINPEVSSSTQNTLVTTDVLRDPEVRSSKSIVRVKDGETVILGGLIHQDKSIEMKKLPILGDIPLLGVFFRHKSQTVGLERELIIFITPHIIRDEADVKLAQVQNIQLPIREQGVSVVSNRDYIINSNMNKFDKSINGKR
ncbi:MAG: hypothetical protein KKC39_06640 [Candidatus Omnitrophica bacterium]|nr:hypothetical protein [Candidatus Omnitrophota bacterium]MBU4303537.1 hypothetical protein [Candidatus Omnitrophota bacterium]MBU4418273.1 hypothetical protein [Candidatus Omnitrophota bacterium]MBU4468396.1 hypothetical protein [Candidatus Omnitrophota bacterium]MCG2708389.1 hypothetical protein [Candidatus Omnitrophota bacterium]